MLIQCNTLKYIVTHTEQFIIAVLFGQALPCSLLVPEIQLLSYGSWWYWEERVGLGGAGKRLQVLVVLGRGFVSWWCMRETMGLGCAGERMRFLVVQG